MMRFLGPLARKVDAPWRMYPIGVLFGLGFDTATEVALLVLAGTAVVGGLPFYAILSLPILFAAGMSLFDTADGCFMNFAYDWAFARPARKIFYNLTITGLSVFVAVFIGGVEVLGLIAQNADLSGTFWSFLAGFNINKAGFVVVGVFVVTWAVALAVWHFGKIEQKWEAPPPKARRTDRRARASGGARFDQVGGPLRVAVVHGPDQPPVRPARRGGSAAQCPAKFLDQPVALAVVAPHARGHAVLPGVRAAPASRHHMVDGLGPVAAIGALVVVPAHERTTGERDPAPVRHADVTAQPDDRGHGEHERR